MLLPTSGTDFCTAADRSLIHLAEALERMSHLFAEQEPVEGRRFGGGAAAGPGGREARHPAIDVSMVRLSIDVAGRAHGAGCTADCLVASSKPALTVADRVPGSHCDDGGASVHTADGDARRASRTAAPTASFKQSSASA